MLLLKLDNESPKPKHAQIFEQIRRRIQNHLLRPGDRLPSTRKLAETLEIHRSTVAVAYHELWALGFIDISAGARPRVRERMQLATPANRAEKALINWSRVSSPGANSIWEAHCRLGSDVEPDCETSSINFRILDMDARLFPVEQFRSCVNRAIQKHGAKLLGHGDYAGFLPLRECIVERLQNHGICVAPEEILITNGSQHGIDLVLRMFGNAGRTIAVESPTYHYLLPLIRSLELNAAEVPLRNDGMDLDLLAETLRRKRPVLVYTMPSFQNPTGISTTQAHRERLLALCEAHRVPILEDGFEEEMTYSGPVVLPVKSMDKHRLVIYGGTFSKVLFPGVRIGWIAADKACIERLIAIRRFSDIFPNPVLQAAMHEFCASGHYDRHIAKMHRVFRKRMQVAIETLRQHVSPDWAQWTEPAGGFLIWLTLRSGISPDWAELFAAHGVHVWSGRYFFAGATHETCVRLSISTLSEEEIVEGIQRLAHALAAAYGTRRARTTAAGHRAR
jgi:DNA-binding transcriptional MocR family regulator